MLNDRIHLLPLTPVDADITTTTKRPPRRTAASSASRTNTSTERTPRSSDSSSAVPRHVTANARPTRKPASYTESPSSRSPDSLPRTAPQRTRPEVTATAPTRTRASDVGEIPPSRTRAGDADRARSEQNPSRTRGTGKSAIDIMNDLESSLDMEIDRPAPRTRTTATARTPVGRADIDTAPVGRSRGERSEASSASRYDRAPVSTGERYLYWFYCVGVRDMNVLWIERGRSQKRILGRIDMQVRNHHHRLDMNVVRG
jgi:hypothetical protein